MKLLLVNKFLYPRGGAETYVLRLGAELARRGHTVAYFGMEDPRNIVGNPPGLATRPLDFHHYGPETLTYPFRILYSREAEQKLTSLIRQFRPDLLHFNNINFQLTPSVLRAGAACGVPMVQTVHDGQMLCPSHLLLEPETGKPCTDCVGRRAKWACVRKRCIHGSRAKSLLGAAEGTLYAHSPLYDRIRRFICPSAFLEQLLCTEPRFRGKTTVLPNFLSPPTLPEAVPKGDYVLFFGRLAPEKGVERILAACRLLPEIPFVFAGSGPLEPLLTACRLPNVRYVGFRTGAELERLVAGAQFTLHLPLWYENCPLALLESQALGTPVLCNCIGGIPELVEEGRTGILNDVFTPEAYAEQIARLYADRALLAGMAAHCRRKRETMMTLARYCDRLLALYGEVLEAAE